MEISDENIDKMVVSYIEKRLETKRAPYRAEAMKKVENIRSQIGHDGRVDELTSKYVELSSSPTLIGWERYCRANSTAKKEAE